MPDTGVHFWDGFLLGAACASILWMILVVWVIDRR